MKKRVLLLLAVCLVTFSSSADRRIDLEVTQAGIEPTAIIIDPSKPIINADDHVIANIDENNMIKLDFVQAAGKNVTMAVFDLTTGDVVYHSVKVVGSQESFSINGCDSGLHMLMISFDNLYFHGNFNID
jgi:hypothetical protein